MWQEKLELHNAQVTIIGSIHFLPLEYENSDVPEWVKESLTSSDMVLFELNKDDITAVGEKFLQLVYFAKAAEIANVPDPNAWCQVLKQSETKFASNFSVGVDFRFMQYCDEMKIPTLSLEKREFQEGMMVADYINIIKTTVDIISKIGMSCISDASEEFLEGFTGEINADKIRGTKTLIDAYLASNYEWEFNSAVMAQFPGMTIVDDAMAVRNMNMAKNIHRIAEENPGKNILVVVGAFHTMTYRSVNNILKDAYGAKEIRE